MTKALPIAVVAAFASVAAPCRAAVTTSWDCFVSAESVDCAQIEAAFFQAMPLLVRAGGDKAALHIAVRSLTVNDGIEYRFDVAGADPRERVSLVDRVPASFTDNAFGSASGGGNGGNGLGGGSDTGGGGGRGTGGGDGRGRTRRSSLVTLRLVGDVQRAVAPFLYLEKPPSADAGALTLVLRDPSLTPGRARHDDSAVPWFVSPTLSGDVSQTALLRVEGRAQLDVSWSDPLLRGIGSAWGTFSYLSAPGPHKTDPSQTFSYAGGGVDVTGVQAIGAGFTVGENARASVAPDQNLLTRFDGYAGIEWVLVPFLTTSGANIGARYEIGVEHQEYVHKNVRDSFEENFLRHRAVAFATWHLPRLDVAGSAAASSMLDDLSYSDVTGTGTLALRATNDLSLLLTGTASYRNGLINAPGNLNELDPLERFVGGGNFGAVTYTASLSVVYVLGNSLLQRQDQRWSNGVEAP